MRYLVTGGAGFIGSNIVRELVNRGDYVRVLDNMSAGKEENLAPFVGKIDFQKGDVRNSEDVKKAVEGIDYVLHHAAFRNVAKSVEDPILTSEVNVNGSLNVLKYSHEAGVKRVVNASTSSVYGECKIYPQDESIEPNPVSPYAISKLAVEYYCKFFSRDLGLDTISLRYFNVFGPNQNIESKYSFVIPAFTSKLLENKPCVIEGDGKQSRDFVYVDDVVRANIAACKLKTSSGEIVNIGSGIDSSIIDIAEHVKNIMGKDIDCEFQVRRPGDVDRTVADISRMKDILGLQPSVSLEDGLRRAVEWFRNSG
ncbi:MAG: SDR family oxidoreductase [Candidatus Omnitrophota bacterium]